MVKNKEEIRIIYKIIHELSERYSVASLCNKFRASRSGYHDFLKRETNYRNRYDINSEDLKGILIELNKKKPTFGYRRLNAMILRELGWVLADATVHKYCKQLGIKSKSRRSYTSIGKEHVNFPRRITKWGTGKPFNVIVSDTTMIRHRGKRYDWTYYLDVFNNEIVGSDIAAFNHGAGMIHHIKALDSMLESKRKRGYIETETTLHTDQGTIYSSKAFENAPINYNIKRSMSRAGTPTDNPVIETLNRWIKCELKYDFKMNNYESTNDALSTYIEYFNNDRFTRKLQNKSPVEFRVQQGFA